jgi:hypothetical protein
LQPKTQTIEPLENTIGRAIDVLAADERVLAAWLEGSFAGGTADPWSDIDLHVAIADNDWDAFLPHRHTLIGRVAPVVSSVSTTMPWGAELIAANIARGVRLDLYTEKRSLLGNAIRREPPGVLFDRAGIADELRINWPADALARLRLEEILRVFFYGATFPVRLVGREEPGSLLLNAMLVVYQFLVPAMLIHDDSAHFFRPQLHNERHLSPERRREVDALVAAIVAAFTPLPSSERDYRALGSMHQRLIGTTWREMRAACERLSVDYPHDAEDAMRAFYAEEMGWDVRA